MPPFLTQKARNRPNYYIRWNPELESVVRINYKNAAALQLLFFLLGISPDTSTVERFVSCGGGSLLTNNTFH